MINLIPNDIGDNYQIKFKRDVRKKLVWSEDRRKIILRLQSNIDLYTNYILRTKHMRTMTLMSRYARKFETPDRCNETSHAFTEIHDSVNNR